MLWCWDKGLWELGHCDPSLSLHYDWTTVTCDTAVVVFRKCLKYQRRQSVCVYMSLAGVRLYESPVAMPTCSSNAVYCLDVSKTQFSFRKRKLTIYQQTSTIWLYIFINSLAYVGSDDPSLQCPMTTRFMGWMAKGENWVCPSRRPLISSHPPLFSQFIKATYCA